VVTTRPLASLEPLPEKRISEKLPPTRTTDNGQHYHNPGYRNSNSGSSAEVLARRREHQLHRQRQRQRHQQAKKQGHEQRQQEQLRALRRRLQELELEVGL
jgi:hypothetical protein